MVSRSYKYILLSTLVLGASMGASTNVFATDPEVDFSVTITPSLSLSVSSGSVNLPITPDSDGEYDSAYFTIDSATNNTYGYTLTMSTENDHTYLESETINVNTGTKPQIQSLTASQNGITAAAFEAATTEANGLNRYGIAFVGSNYTNTLHNGNYNAVASPTTIYKSATNNASGVDNTTVNIAAKLNLAVPAGTYKNKFIIQMVANPMPGTLEAAYQNAGKTKATIGNKQYYAMQDMTPTICNNVTVTDDVIEVYDKRDNTIYHIGKLADNKCWLLDNLALDLTNSTILNGLTADNTNADNTTLGYLKGTTTRDTSTDPDGNYATSGVANWTTGSSYSDPLMNISNKSILPTTYYQSWNDTYVDDSMKDQVEAGHWKVGGYYNYCAASAGSYCYDGTSAGTSSGNTTADICPSGWRIPTGGAGGEYQLLANAITGGTSDYIDTEPEISNIRSALRLPLSGNFSSDSADFQGSYGYFWSSTRYYDDDMYVLTDSSFVYPQDFYSRDYGFSVRCVAQ